MSENRADGPLGNSAAQVPASQEIVQRLEPFVPPERMGDAVRVVSTMIAHSHSGPLPPAREFANYDKALPGAAERILAMAEKEQSHRHGIEQTVVTKEVGFKTQGQWFAFVGLLVMLGAVLAMALLGHAAAGASLGGAIILGVVALFLGQKWSPANRPSPSDED